MRRTIVLLTTMAIVRGGQQSPVTPLGKEKIVKTVRRLNHLRAALMAGAAAGLLAAVALLVVLYAQPAEANFPGTPGRIAYTNVGGGVQIYTIKPDGGGRVQVTNNSPGAFNPAYSPSGKRIAYSSDEDGDFEIYTIKPGGGGKVQVTENSTEETFPSYSPSGKRIAYTSHGEINTIKPDGGGQRKVTDITTAAAFQPYWGSQ